MSVLRGYARMTILVPVAVVVLGMEIFNLRDRSMPWRGDLTWSLDWWGTAFVLTGPLIAAAVAVDSGTSSRPGRADLLAGPSGRRRLAVGLVASYITVLGLVHFLVLLVYLRGIDRWSLQDMEEVLLVAAYSVAVIAFYVALGYCLGRVLPVFVSPVAALVVVIVMRALTTGSGLDILDAGGSTGAMLEVGYRWTWLLLALGACLLLAAVLVFAETSGGRRSGRIRAPWLVPAAGVGCCVVLAAGVLPAAAAPSRLVPSSERLVQDCVEGVPRVCVFDAHARLLDQAYNDVHQLWTAATELGLTADLPQTYAELSPTASAGERGVGAVDISTSTLSTGRLDPSQLAYSLVEPVWCPSLYGPTAPAVLLDRTSDVAAAIAARSALGPNATPPTPARKRQLQKELGEVSACR